MKHGVWTVHPILETPEGSAHRVTQTQITGLRFQKSKTGFQSL